MELLTVMVSFIIVAIWKEFDFYLSVSELVQVIHK